MKRFLFLWACLLNSPGSACPSDFASSDSDANLELFIQSQEHDLRFHRPADGRCLENTWSVLDYLSRRPEILDEYLIFYFFRPRNVPPVWDEGMQAFSVATFIGRATKEITERYEHRAGGKIAVPFPPIWSYHVAIYHRPSQRIFDREAKQEVSPVQTYLADMFSSENELMVSIILARKAIAFPSPHSITGAFSTIKAIEWSIRMGDVKIVSVSHLLRDWTELSKILDES